MYADLIIIIETSLNISQFIVIYFSCEEFSTFVELIAHYKCMNPV